ncbi:MAG TPA: glycerophosphodiester phosphodiesterase family protein [Candidatus Brocadiia bacterium]|nr:glycerophosphodiester phosphodiesterase family protein [Candidatus Brocadiia bacterium]
MATSFLLGMVSGLSAHAGEQQRKPVDFRDIGALMKDRPLLICAHRGGVVGPGSPQCSLEAIRRAAADGYDMVELDVRASKDGRPVVFHDASLAFACGDLRMCSMVPFGELTRMRHAGTNESIPSLEAAVALCAELGLGIQIDVKDSAENERTRRSIKETAAAIEKRGLAPATMTISNGGRFIDEILSGKITFSISPNEFKRFEERGEPVPTDHCVFGHAIDLPDELVKRISARGMLIMASINTHHYLPGKDMEQAEKDIARLRAAGVTGYQIDSDYMRYLRPAGR